MTNALPWYFSCNRAGLFFETKTVGPQTEKQACPVTAADFVTQGLRTMRGLRMCQQKGRITKEQVYHLCQPLSTVRGRMQRRRYAVTEEPPAARWQRRERKRRRTMQVHGRGTRTLAQRLAARRAGR
jgi:hypothetical protein